MGGDSASGTLHVGGHSHGSQDNRLTCAIALTLFATGIALSLLLIAAYSRPFTGEISVGPKLLKQVITSESAITQP